MITIILKNVVYTDAPDCYLFFYSVKFNSILHSTFLDSVGNYYSETVQESHEKEERGNINFEIYDLHSDVMVKNLDHFRI